MAKAKAKVDRRLVKAVDALVKKVKIGAKDENGKPYTLTDVCKVLDRRLKLEAIIQKADDQGYGEGFGETESEEEGEEE